MAKSKVHRKAKVSTSKSRKGMQRPARKPAITRFSDGAVEKTQTQQQAQRTQKTQRSQKSQKSQKTQKDAQIKVAKSKKQQPEKPAKQFDMSGINAEMRRRAARRKKTEFSVQPILPAQQIKEQEIMKAISATNRSFSQERRRWHRHYLSMNFSFRRVAVAMVCAAIGIVAIVCLVNANSPDFSIKVAAMQTGIDAHYPNYVPRDYTLSDITSESGKITLNFKNEKNGNSFSLIEEKSDWNNSTLLKEFVKPNFAEYTVVSEGNLSIYISDSDAAWLSDGIFYRIVTKTGLLTKKQISTIATKL